MKKLFFPAFWILDPVFIFGGLLIWFNDTFLKTDRIYKPVAGKLSDIGLMIIVPAFICLVTTLFKYIYYSGRFLGTGTRTKRWHFVPSLYESIPAAFATALFFLLLQVSTDFAKTYIRALNHLVPGFWNFKVTADWTDLFCLPVLVLPVWTMHHKRIKIKKKTLDEKEKQSQDQNLKE